jgi:hypothetical protein
LIIPAAESGLLITGIDYRFALSNQLLVGAGLGFLTSFNQGADNYNLLFLQPSVRYYLPSGIGKGFFAEGNAFLGFDNDEEAISSFALGLGYQWAVAPGVLLTPSARYNINGGFNDVGIGLGLEFLLNAANKGQKPLAAFEKGDLLIGTDLMGITINQFTIGIDLRPVAYKFLNEETALGVGLKIGYEYFSRDIGMATLPRNIVSRSGNLGLDVRLRRYLGATSRLRLFAEISAGADGSFLSVDNSGNNFEEQTLEAVFGLAAGAQFFIRESFSFEFGPSYRYFTGEPDGTRIISLNAGVRWRWRRSKD